MADPHDFLNDPAYGIDAVIGVPTDDLLPATGLVKILRRHITQRDLLPDAMVEHLLYSITSGGSVRPQYNLTPEQLRTLDADGRRHVLYGMLDDLVTTYGDLYWRQGHPDTPAGE